VSDIALFVRLQARVATFLAELPEERLLALVDGRATLTVTDGVDAWPAVVVPHQANESSTAVRASPPRPSADVQRPKTAAPEAGSIDAATIVRQLRDCQTVDAATAMLAGLKLNLPNTKLVAKELKIPVGGKKDDLARKIINLTVAGRIKHAGLRDR